SAWLRCALAAAKERRWRSRWCDQGNVLRFSPVRRLPSSRESVGIGVGRSCTVKPMHNRRTVTLTLALRGEGGKVDNIADIARVTLTLALRGEGGRPEKKWKPRSYTNHSHHAHSSHHRRFARPRPRIHAPIARLRLEGL